MHEYSLIANLIDKLKNIAKKENALRIKTVRVKLGALSHMSPDHFREHFEPASRGTPAEGAKLEVIALTDPDHPEAQEIRLESVDIEE